MRVLMIILIGHPFLKTLQTQADLHRSTFHRNCDSLKSHKVLGIDMLQASDALQTQHS